MFTRTHLGVGKPRAGSMLRNAPPEGDGATTSQSCATWLHAMHRQTV